MRTELVLDALEFDALRHAEDASSSPLART
jgi:hypothetical protein